LLLIRTEKNSDLKLFESGRTYFSENGRYSEYDNYRFLSQAQQVKKLEPLKQEMLFFDLKQMIMVF